MEIILFWFLISIAIWIWASNKGRNGFGWFVLAIIISPILAAIFLAVSADLSKKASTAPDAPTPGTHVTCPDCAEFVRKEARVCKHCGCKLIPAVETPIAPVGETGLTVWQTAGIVLALLLAYAVYASSNV